MKGYVEKSISAVKRKPTEFGLAKILLEHEKALAELKSKLKAKEMRRRDNKLE